MTFTRLQLLYWRAEIYEFARYNDLYLQCYNIYKYNSPSANQKSL